MEDGTDETADYIASREKAEDETREFTITVNPTLACNMKCWYCYETHKNMPTMSVTDMRTTYRKRRENRCFSPSIFIEMTAIKQQFL